MRLVTFEFTFPLLFGCSFEFDQRRVDYAFVNATVFGWLTNAGFAAVAFMTPRLLGRRMAMEAGLTLGRSRSGTCRSPAGSPPCTSSISGPTPRSPPCSWLFEGGLAFGAHHRDRRLPRHGGGSLRSGLREPLVHGRRASLDRWPDRPQRPHRPGRALRRAARARTGAGIGLRRARDLDAVAARHGLRRAPLRRAARHRPAPGIGRHRDAHLPDLAGPGAHGARRHAGRRERAVRDHQPGPRRRPCCFWCRPR